MVISYEDAPVAVRPDIAEAHNRAWARLGGAGTWLDAETRVAIMAESRHAGDCALCAARKEALSPNAVAGTHDSLGKLPNNIVEVVHRIVTDPGRLSQSWYRKMLESGLTEEEYVEIVGVTCSTVSVDTFARALGLVRRDLPEAGPGTPKCERPDAARQGDAWVPWIAGPDAPAEYLDQFGPGASNIRRALSLVPDEAYGFFDLVGAQYLDADQMRDFDTPHRAISRPQIELVAGRISFLNQCAY